MCREAWDARKARDIRLAFLKYAVYRRIVGEKKNFSRGNFCLTRLFVNVFTANSYVYMYSRTLLLQKR